MKNTVEQLVIVSSRGHDDERATVAWTVANGAQASGLKVTMFLVSSAIDMVRKGAADHVRMNPFDPPMKEMIDNFVGKGGQILACPPCSKVRGYAPEDLLDGVIITGSGAMHALIKEGAATLCF